MKKVLSVLLAASLILGLGTSAVAEVKSKKYLEAYQLIEKTNEIIEDVIIEGTREASELQEYYLNSEKGKKVKESSNDKKIKNIKSYLGKLNGTKKEKNNGNDKMVSLSSDEVNEVIDLFGYEDIYLVDNKNSVINNMTNSILSVEDQDTAIQYYLDLGKIISDVSNTTLGMSNETIKLVADMGVKARCYWVKVQFAELHVYIDPISIVGEN